MRADPTRVPAPARHAARRRESPRDLLTDLLEEIAADPEAGAWGDWARKLLAADQAGEAAASPATGAGKRSGRWRPPRKPR